MYIATRHSELRNQIRWNTKYSLTTEEGTSQQLMVHDTTLPRAMIEESRNIFFLRRRHCACSDAVYNVFPLRTILWPATDYLFLAYCQLHAFIRISIALTFWGESSASVSYESRILFLQGDYLKYNLKLLLKLLFLYLFTSSWKYEGSSPGCACTWIGKTGLAPMYLKIYLN